MSSHGRIPKRSTMRWLGLDIACVAVFVIVGRRNHDEAFTVSGLSGALAPFLIALVASWFLTGTWRDPKDARKGALVWIGTVTLGMVLRRFVFDDGTATAFVIVATVFLGVFLNGTRALARFRAGS